MAEYFSPMTRRRNKKCRKSFGPRLMD